jgi:hypothetical protein
MENVEQTTAANEQEVPKVTLLSAISYTSRADYEAFLTTMTGEHAIVTLIAAANHAQSRGAYNLDEAELVAKAIRKLTVQPEAQAEAPVEAPIEAESAEAPAKKAAAKSAPKKPTRSRKQ